MKNFLLLLTALLFSGCMNVFNIFSGSPEVSSSGSSEDGYEEIMRIKADCGSCASGGGSNLIINGTEYSSDIAIKCCLKQSRIDTGAAIKKIYIHAVKDERSEDSGVRFISQKGQTLLYTKDRLEGLFYAFLKNELQQRGIMVVESQTSPYTYRVDFAFTGYEGIYSQRSASLSAVMQGKLGVKNINKTRVLNVSTKQNVRKLEASDIGDFSLYIHLLVKQMANKVAEEISKI